MHHDDFLLVRVYDFLDSSQESEFWKSNVF